VPLEIFESITESTPLPPPPPPLGTLWCNLHYQMEVCGADVDKEDLDGWNALMHAAMEGIGYGVGS